jgi:hypothetical protein
MKFAGPAPAVEIRPADHLMIHAALAIAAGQWLGHVGGAGDPATTRASFQEFEF